jgi:hypothetical protein
MPFIHGMKENCTYVPNDHFMHFNMKTPSIVHALRTCSQ